MIRNYSNGIWYFNLRPDFETNRVMPSGTRITQCEHGVLITGKGYVRFIKNDYYEENRIEDL